MKIFLIVVEKAVGDQIWKPDFSKFPLLDRSQVNYLFVLQRGFHSRGSLFNQTNRGRSSYRSPLKETRPNYPPQRLSDLLN